MVVSNVSCKKKRSEIYLIFIALIINCIWSLHTLFLLMKKFWIFSILVDFCIIFFKKPTVAVNYTGTTLKRLLEQR